MNIVNKMTKEIIEFIKRKMDPEPEKERKNYQDDEESIDPIFEMVYRSIYFPKEMLSELKY
jgi:IS30 family transposase